MKIQSLAPLLALIVLPLSAEPARAPSAPAGAHAARLARIVAADADDLAQMLALCELAQRDDLTRAQRAVLDARCAGRVRALDARAHGVPAAPAAPDLTARGLGLAALSLGTREDALRAGAALAEARDGLTRAAARLADPRARAPR